MFASLVIAVGVGFGAAYLLAEPMTEPIRVVEPQSVQQAPLAKLLVDATPPSIEIGEAVSLER